MDSVYLHDLFKQEVVSSVSTEALTRNRPSNAFTAAAMLSAPAGPKGQSNPLVRRVSWAVDLKRPLLRCFDQALSRFRCWQLDVFMSIQLPAFATALGEALQDTRKDVPELLVCMQDRNGLLSGIGSEQEPACLAVLAERRAASLGEISFGIFQNHRWSPTVFSCPRGNKKLRLGAHKGDILLLTRGAARLPLVVVEVIDLNSHSLGELRGSPAD